MADRQDYNRNNRNYDREADRNRDFPDDYSRREQSFQGGDYDRSYDQQRSSDWGDERHDRQGFYSQSDRGESSQRGSMQRDGYGETGGDYQGGIGRSHYDNRQGRGFSSFNANDGDGRDFAAAGGGSGYGGGGYGGAYGSAGGGAYAGTAGHNRYGNDDRGFFDKASDEIASWFGDDEAERRRERDHRGRGPSNYQRSDERILEDACDRLTDDYAVDASDITVAVQDSEVTLDGRVSDRRSKRRAEDCVHDVSGVTHVQNNLRVHDKDGDYDRTATANPKNSGTLA